MQSGSRQAATASEWQELEVALRAADISARPTLLARCLEFLLGRVNALRVDSANARLRRIVPMIKLHGTEYERGKFCERLSRGALTLEHTTAWLRGSLLRLSTVRPDVFAAILRGCPSAFVAAHAAAVMDLIVGDGAVVSAPPASWPETLRLDARRMRELSAEFRLLVLIAIAVVTVREQFDLGPPAAVSEAVAQELTAAPAPASPLPDAGSLEEQVAAVYDRFCSDAEATRRMRHLLRRRLATPTDPVHSLMRRRMRGVWEAAAGGRSGDGEPVPLGGLEALLPRVCEAAGRVGRMAAVNRQVHLPHYDSIIAEAAKSISQTPAPSPAP